MTENNCEIEEKGVDLDEEKPIWEKLNEDEQQTYLLKILESFKQNKTSLDFLPQISPWIKKAIEISQTKEVLPTTFQLLLKNILPTFVQILFTTEYPSSSLHDINSFFQSCLHLIANTCQYVFQEALWILNVLMGASIKQSQPPILTFYHRYTLPSSSVIRKISSLQDFAGGTAASEKVSKFLLMNINFFYSKEGFFNIIQIIQNPPDLFHLNYLESLIESFYHIHTLCHPDCFIPVVVPLKDSVFHFFLKCPFEKFNIFTRKDIDRVIHILEILYRYTPFNIDYNHSFEEFYWYLNIRFLHSKSLPKRIEGLNELKEFVTLALQKKEYLKSQSGLIGYVSSVVGGDIPPPGSFRWMTCEWIVEHIISDNLLQIIYEQSSIHIELIRRSSTFLSLLAENKKLTHKHLDLVWGLASTHEHESLEHLVYNIISTLSVYLSLSELNYLMDVISKKPYSDYDTQMMNFVKSITLIIWTKQIQEKNPLNSIGIKIFYEISQLSDHNQKSLGVDFFIELLKVEETHPIKIEYIKKSVYKVQYDKNAADNLFILRKILESYPTTSRSWYKTSRGNIDILQNLSTRSEVIEYINNSWNILDHIIQNLESSKVINYSLELKGQNESKENQLSTGRYINNQKLILNFLLFMLENSSINLSISQLSKIWQLFHNFDIKLTSDEKNILYHWLAECVKPTHLHSSLKDEDIKVLYETKILAIDHSLFTQTGFQMLKNFFIFVNVQYKRIQLVDNTYRIINYKEVQSKSGSGYFYKMILLHPDDQIAQQAIIFLNSLYCVKIYNPETKTIRDDHISWCLKQLQKDTIDDKFKSRVLNMLTLYFNLYRVTIPQMHFLIEPVKDLRVEPFNIWLNINQTGSELKASIFCKLSEFLSGITPENIILKSNQKIINNNQMHSPISVIFSDFPLDQICHIQIFRKETPFSRFINQVEIIQTIPSTFLLAPAVPSFGFEVFYNASNYSLPFKLNTTHYSLIFSLFKFLPYFSEKIWDLLIILPYDSERKNQILKLNVSKWDEFFRCSNLYYFTYDMIIIDSLLNSPQNLHDWLLSFIHQGGVGFLLQEATNERFFFSNYHESLCPLSIFAHCISLLFKILHYFFCLDPLYYISPEIKNDAIRYSFPSGIITQRSDCDPQFLHLLFVTIMSSCRPSLEKVPDIVYTMIINSYHLLMGSVCTYPVLLEDFCQYPELSEWIEYLLLRCPNTSVRIACAQGLHKLSSQDINIPCIKEVTLQGFFIQILIKIYSDEKSILSFSQQSQQFFTLLIRLLDDICSKSNVTIMSQIYSFCENLINCLKKHDSIESYQSRENDHYLIGILRLLRVMIRNNIIQPKEEIEKKDILLDLMSFLYHQCLFDSTNQYSPNGVKCKEAVSRCTSYSLLLDIIKKYEKLSSTLLDMLSNDPIWRITPSSWQREGYHPSLIEKYPNKYVGLVNQGGTCYMNSLLQQIYMVPTFRRDLILLEKSPLNEMDIFFQMQVLFSYLVLSQKRFYDTLPLYIDGQMIKLNEQKDVYEFCQMLFDQMETSLANSSNPTLINNFFLGQTVSQIISQECAHTSEKPEKYYMISLEIKNKANLLESLKLYVEGEMMEGNNKYLCSQCHQKVVAIRRTCFDSDHLPPTLMIQLKRFEFNFDTMRKYKINDTFKFPIEFSMKPFTKEGLFTQESSNDLIQQVEKSDSEYMYYLKGVIVHTGSADLGHYYSIIQDRETLEWFEFNDTVVKLFDEKQLDSVCFGGEIEEEYLDARTGKRVKQIVQKMLNAYMLIYEKKPLLENDQIPHQLTLSRATSSEKAQFIPSFIFEQLSLDNQQLLADKYLFDFHYLTFLWHIIHMNFKGQNLLICGQLSILYVFNIIIRSTDHGTFHQWMHYIHSFLSNSSDLCRWLLRQCQNKNWIEGILFKCEHIDIRECFVDVLIIAWKQLHELEKQSFSSIEEKELGVIQQPSATVSFISFLISWLNQIKIYFKKFREYFMLLYGIALLGVEERQLLIKFNLVELLVNFYMDHDPLIGFNFLPSPTDPLNQKRIHPPRCSFLIQTILLLVRDCSLYHISHPQQLCSFHLPDSSYSALSQLHYKHDHYPFLLWILFSENHINSALSMISYLSWENMEYSCSLWCLIQNELDIQIKKSGNDVYFSSLFRCIYEILSIQDSIQEKRIEMILPLVCLTFLFHLIANSKNTLFINHKTELFSNSFISFNSHEIYVVVSFSKQGFFKDNFRNIIDVSKHS